MPATWTLQELTELDLQLRGGVSAEDDSPKTPPDPEASKTEVLRAWLDRVRPRHPDAARHAATAVQSEAWLRTALILFSLVAGAAAAAALLRYEGDRLINISAYLGVLVGGQLLLLLALAASALLLRTPARGLPSMLLPKVVRDAPALYAFPAWRWRMFTSFQEAGLAFNTGVILCTLWKVLTYDLAFGWATTLRVDGAAMHRLVTFLSTPWGGAFAPDADQIRQSRIVLKEGLAQVDTASAASWWPFLLMCVLTYGLLPRAALALFGRGMLSRKLRTPPLHQPSAERLYQHLTRAPLSFSVEEDEAANRTRPKADTLPALTPTTPLTLVEGEDVLSDDRRAQLLRRLEKQAGVAIRTESSDDAGIVRLCEVWQPPLEETLRELRHLRASLGPDKDLLMLCVGFPAPEASDRLFEAPDENDLAVWRERLAELHDPRLGMWVWKEDAA